MTLKQAIDHLSTRAYARELVGDHKTAQAVGMVINRIDEITALGEELRMVQKGIKDKNTLELILQLIDAQPTADVTNVICCKDCFYAKPYNAKWQLPIKENELWCSYHEEEKTQEYFCADAIERMVEE